MNEDFPNFNLDLDEYLKPKRQKTDETRFAQLNDDELDDLVEGAQAKSTKHATNYAVSVFKGNFSVKILLRNKNILQLTHQFIFTPLVKM